MMKQSVESKRMMDQPSLVFLVPMTGVWSHSQMSLSSKFDEMCSIARLIRNSLLCVLWVEGANIAPNLALRLIHTHRVFGLVCNGK